MDSAAWDQQLFTLLHPPLLDLLGEPVWRWLTSLALPLTLLLVTSAWGWHARRPCSPSELLWRPASLPNNSLHES